MNRKLIKKILHEGLNIPKVTTPEQWFQNLLYRMNETYEPEYPNKTFYSIKGDKYMVYNPETGYLRYDYNKIYIILREKYRLNHNEMNKLIKNMVEQHYDLTGITPIGIPSIKF